MGLGGIGQRHVRNLRALTGPGTEIIAFRIRNNSHVLTDQLEVEAETRLEDRYAIHVFPDLDQALAQGPDVAFICNPSSLHISTALQAARAGCHLFIEKPLSHNFVQVEELISLVENQNLTAVVGFQMRFHPCLLYLHSLIQAGTIGRILTVRVEVGEYLPSWHPYEDYRQMYASRRDLGGGVLLTQIHELDYLYWLFGLPERVFALGGHLSSLEVDVEDVVEILMEYRLDDRELPISVHQDYIQRPPTRTCTVIGDAGRIQLDFRALSVIVFDAVGIQVEVQTYAPLPRNQLFLDEMNKFLSALQGNPSPLVSLRDGAQSLRMALAARESLSSGKVIDIAGWRS